MLPRRRGRTKSINSRERNAFGLNDVKRLEVATDVPLLALGVSLLLDEVREVVVALKGRGDTGTSRVLERVTGDGVRDGGAGKFVGVGGVGAVRGEVDLDDLAGVRVDDAVHVEGVGL